jgi:hypothetical protein
MGNYSAKREGGGGMFDESAFLATVSVEKQNSATTPRVGLGTVAEWQAEKRLFEFFYAQHFEYALLVERF